MGKAEVKHLMICVIMEIIIIKGITVQTDCFFIIIILLITGGDNDKIYNVVTYGVYCTGLFKS